MYADAVQCVGRRLRPGGWGNNGSLRVLTSLWPCFIREMVVVPSGDRPLRVRVEICESVTLEPAPPHPGATSIQRDAIILNRTSVVVQVSENKRMRFRLSDGMQWGARSSRRVGYMWRIRLEDLKRLKAKSKLLVG